MKLTIIILCSVVISGLVTWAFIAEPEYKHGVIIEKTFSPGGVATGINTKGQTGLIIQSDEYIIFVKSIDEIHKISVEKEEYFSLKTNQIIMLKIYWYGVYYAGAK